MRIRTPPRLLRSFRWRESTLCCPVSTTRLSFRLSGDSLLLILFRF
ncbi:hypothetical protein MKleb_5458 (plasmid) [Klebsiella sp. PL-2018]|nr:hypothetical protein MKleb_5458 [Klebsiella sp. PL-2018]